MVFHVKSWYILIHKYKINTQIQIGLYKMLECVVTQFKQIGICAEHLYACHSMFLTVDIYLVIHVYTLVRIHSFPTYTVVSKHILKLLYSVIVGSGHCISAYVRFRAIHMYVCVGSRLKGTRKTFVDHVATCAMINPHQYRNV